MPANLKHKTREAWLMAAVDLLKPLFTENSYKVPEKLRVSCGFPSHNAFGKKQAEGECWSDHASKGKIFEIFISPILEKPVAVLDVLVHEIVHATVGLKCGHKGAFKTCAIKVGLEGKMTSAAAGPDLLKRLGKLVPTLGTYPHDELSKMTNGKEKAGTRLLKITCPGCGYVLRVTRKWLEVGSPTCCCGEEFEEGGE